MSDIKVIKNPSLEMLNSLGVSEWGIWTHEVADFPWMYGAEETCYFIEGKVTVIPNGSEPVDMEKGDLVTFPKGMECRWIIHEAVRKHYMFA